MNGSTWLRRATGVTPPGALGRRAKTSRTFVLLALALACPLGCRGETGDAEADAALEQARIGACDLVTKAEVEAALGATVDDPYQTDGEGYAPGGTGLVSQCNFDRGLVDGVAIIVHQFVGEGFERKTTSAEWAQEMTEQFDEQRADPSLAEAVPPGGARSLDMPGHAAIAILWDGFVTVQVRQQGSQRVGLSVTAPTLEIGETVAQKALARLPPGGDV